MVMRRWLFIVCLLVTGTSFNGRAMEQGPAAINFAMIQFDGFFENMTLMDSEFPDSRLDYFRTIPFLCIFTVLFDEAVDEEVRKKNAGAMLDRIILLLSDYTRNRFEFKSLRCNLCCAERVRALAWTLLELALKKEEVWRQVFGEDVEKHKNFFELACVALKKSITHVLKNCKEVPLPQDGQLVSAYKDKYIM